VEFQFHGLDYPSLKIIAENICRTENREIPDDRELAILADKSGGSARSFTNLLFQYLVGGIVPETTFNIAAYLKAIKMNDIEGAKKQIISVTYSELIKQVIEVLLRAKNSEKYQEIICKLGDYLLLSQNPDENLGKIVVTLQLKKYLNS
jgi:DNA polymerase III gamma/tau subunit